MRKFIIALEVDLNDMEANNPELWLKRIVGSVKMRHIKSIKAEEVNEHSGVQVPKPKPRPKAKTDRER